MEAWEVLILRDILDRIDWNLYNNYPERGKLQKDEDMKFLSQIVDRHLLNK